MFLKFDEFSLAKKIKFIISNHSSHAADKEESLSRASLSLYPLLIKDSKFYHTFIFYLYIFFLDQTVKPLALQPLVTQTLEPTTTTISSQQTSVVTTNTNTTTTSEGVDELTFAIAAIDSTTATRPISVLEQHCPDESPDDQNDLKKEEDSNDQRSVSVLDKYLKNTPVVVNNNNNDFDRPGSVLEYRHPEYISNYSPEGLENITEIDDNASIVTTKCETPVTYELEAASYVLRDPQIILPVIDMNTRPGSSVNIEPDHPAIPTSDVMQELLVSSRKKS